MSQRGQPFRPFRSSISQTVGLVTSETRGPKGAVKWPGRAKPAGGYFRNHRAVCRVCAESFWSRLNLYDPMELGMTQQLNILLFSH